MGIRNKCFYGWGYKQGEVGYTPSLPLNKKWMGGMPMRARSRCKAHTREDCVGVCVRVCVSVRILHLLLYPIILDILLLGC